MKKEVNKILVYGILKKKNIEFSDFLREGKIRYIGKGSIHAKLYDLGEYPGAVEWEKGDVYGEVYEITDLGEVIPKLDKYEEFYPNKLSSSLFVRKTSKVSMETGEEVTAYVYFYNRKINHAKTIPTGRWADKS